MLLKNITKSIVSRVLFVTIVLLVLPLLFYILFIYEKEYKLRAELISTHLVDESETHLLASLKEQLFTHIVVLFSLFILCAGGILLLMILYLSKPLTQLRKVMHRVEKGDLKTRFIPQKLGFEINNLGLIFNETIDSLLLKMEEAKREKIEKEAYLSELKIGHQIQKSIFPLELPDFPKLEIATQFLPAKEVGGDFYDLFKREDGKLVIVIADTSGKGISACLYSLGLRSMLRCAATSLDDLQEIVKKINTLFLQDTRDSGMFVTAWIGIYDGKKDTLEYACLGHHPPLLIHKNGQVEKLKTDGTLALGIEPYQEIPLSKITLKKDNLLFLFTDGIVEAIDQKGKPFGEKRLIDLLTFFPKTSCQSLSEHLISELRRFTAGKEPFDDITYLILKII